MKNFIKGFIYLQLFLLLSCSENIVSTEHLDAVGMRIVSSGTVLTSYIRSDISAFSAITVESGTQTSHLDIEFYDDESEEWTSPTNSDYTLEIDIADTSICQYWQHDDEQGGFEFHLQGKNSGSTSSIFRILHDGHSDFESRPVSIIVNPTE